MSTGESRPRGNTVASYGYDHTTVASGVVAPSRPACTVGGAFATLDWTRMLTVSVADAVWPMIEADTWTTAPSEPLAVKRPLPSTAPICGESVVHEIPLEMGLTEPSSSTGLVTVKACVAFAPLLLAMAAVSGEMVMASESRRA